jgi:3-oxoacyl-[acyl-carrier-protein] synthase II
MDQPASEIDHPYTITGCGILSAVGIGFKEFATAIQAGRSGCQLTEGHFAEPLPTNKACFIPDFKASTFLGKKGTAFLDRTTALVMVASGMALQDGHLSVTNENRHRVGLVVGTSTGSIQSISDYAKEPLLQQKPYLVNPLIFPNTVMNCAAGQAAIRYGLKGVNATVAGGQLSTILALRYATMLIRLGHADTLLVSSVEEFSVQAAWGFHLTREQKGIEAVPGEGCVTFIVESASAARAAGRTARAEILACAVGRYRGLDDVANKLAACIHRALLHAGVIVDQVEAVAGSMVGNNAYDRAEEEGIRMALGRVPERLLKVKPLLGECYSAAGAFQLAALLALEEQGRPQEEQIALVTSVDYTGSLGCLVIRRCQW